MSAASSANDATAAGAKLAPTTTCTTIAAAAARVSVSPRPTMTLSSSPRYCGLAPPPFQEPPQSLPDAAANGLLAFDVDEKKHQIFEQARRAIRTSAQYNQRGRKPWTQITVRLPVVRGKTTTPDEDLAVVWALMRNSAFEGDVKQRTSFPG